MKAYLRVVLSVGLVVTMTFNCALAQDSLPNILIILADDLGFADVSYYTGIDASTDLQTPHINTLAEQGIRFNNFYANSTVCSPTRASLMTGRYPGLVGVPGVLRTDPTTSWGYLSPTVATLADQLKTGGYYTGLVGKWHLGLGPPNLPNQRGFDYFHGFLGDMMDDYCDHLRHGINYMRENDRVLTSEEHEGIHATELFTNWAIAFIQQRASTGQPFFLYLAYNAPHYPIQPPPCPCQAPPDLDEGVARAELVKLVEDLDANIGRVIGALADAGVKEDTLVIFTSDNGGQWDDVIKDLSDTRANNGPYRGSKGWLYDGGIRVPAVAVWPNRIAAGEASDAVALTMDLFPTLLEVAGIESPQDIDGASLLPVMEGSGTLPAERPLFWERREGYAIGGAYHAVRSGAWKLVQPHMPTDPFELYDLLEDPHENNERCDEDADICSGLHQLVDGYIGASALVPYRDSLPVDGQAFTIDETVEAEQFDIYITASPSGVYDTGEGAAYHDNEPDNLLDGNWRPGEGIDINASTEASNGYNVGSAQAGEWLAYTMGIPAPGTYRFVGRVASPTGSGTFHVEFLDEDKTGPLVIPDTGGWQSWTQIESDSFRLEPGTQKMRIVLDADAVGSGYVGNFDWFKIIPADNIALRKPVVASSVEDNDPDLAADKAVDGYPNTRWSSQYSDPQWIAVDLGSRHVISRVVLEWEAAFGTEYAIQVSDDMQQWSPVYHATDGDGGTDDLAIAGSGRYVRMYGIQRGTPWGYSLWEFEIFGTPSSIGDLASSMEFGEVSIDHHWTRVELEKVFDDPVVVAGPLSLNGDDPAVVRIRNVDANGFEIRVQEWDYLDGNHTTETVGYLVIEAGDYILDDGTILEARTIDTTAADAFAQVVFDTAFSVAPVVMSTITSINDPTAVTGRIRQVTTGGFQFRMQEQEANVQDHGAERLSYLAWEPSSGSLGEISFQIQHTADEVTHTGYPIFFDPPFGSVPVFLADIQTTDGGDTAGVRFESKNGSTTDVLIDEEASMDEETDHTNEVVGWMAFNRDEAPVIDNIAFEDCISEPCTTTLMASAHDPAGGVLTFEWDEFDDGSVDGTGDSFLFDPPGPSTPLACDPYFIKLTVTSSASGLSTEEIVGITVKLAGDANGDGVVNILDKVAVRNAFGQSGAPGWIDADVDCNGVVNILDKVIVRNQFGQSGCACP